MMLFELALWLMLLGLGLYFLVLRKPEFNNESEEIIRKRYARGEISSHEFTKMFKILEKK